MSSTSLTNTISKIMLKELPSHRVVALCGPIESANDIHPIHKKFSDLVLANPSFAQSFGTIAAPNGSNVQTGALVYGDYNEPEPVMKQFKQCLFMGQDFHRNATAEVKLALADLLFSDPSMSIESVPIGRYAVTTFVGEYSLLPLLVREMMYLKLPAMKLTHSGGPTVEFYHGVNADGSPVTELAIPVVKIRKGVTSK